jgi:uncharacterized protein (DUF1778 family)
MHHVIVLDQNEQFPGEFFNLSEEAQRKIAELLNNPPEPSERLKAAHKRYCKFVEESIVMSEKVI